MGRSPLEALLAGESSVGGLCVVTCSEAGAGIFAALEPITRATAGWVRLSGPVLETDGEAARAVAATVTLLGLCEVLVVTHENCAFLQTTHDAVSRALGAGVRRDALGADARRSLGLLGVARAGASEAARSLRASVQLPKNVLVHAAVITAGRLELIDRASPSQAAAEAVSTRMAEQASRAAPSPRHEEPTLPQTALATSGPVQLATPAPEAWFAYAEKVAVPIDLVEIEAVEISPRPPPLPMRRDGWARVDLLTGRVMGDPVVELSDECIKSLQRVRNFARVHVPEALRRDARRAVDEAAASGAELKDIARVAGRLIVTSRKGVPREDLARVWEVALDLRRDSAWGLLRSIYD